MNNSTTAYGHSQSIQTLDEQITNASQRAPLSYTTRPHYSELFTIDTSINPVVAAAAPLLSLLSKLAVTTEPPNLETLHGQLVHEVKAFESTMHHQAYRSDTILLARYALCACLDDIIEHTPWGADEAWQPWALLQHFQHDTGSHNRFFTILERISEDPDLYIELIELQYICLQLGFMGPYRATEEGFRTLATIIENTYQSIRLQRGAQQRALGINEQPARNATQKNKMSTRRMQYNLLGVAVILATIYGGLSLLLSANTSPLVHTVHAIQSELGPQQEKV